MIDCGEGTQQQLLLRAQTKLGRLQKILVTHLHGDHVFGLPGLMCSMGMLGVGSASTSASGSNSVADPAESEEAPEEGQFNGRILELYGWP